jgi:UDP-glucose 6-dehydrogenase
LRINELASTHNERKATIINERKSPFFEAGLQEMMTSIKNDNPELLQCLTVSVKAVLEINVSMITQGKPLRKDKSIDLSTLKVLQEKLVKK